MQILILIDVQHLQKGSDSQNHSSSYIHEMQEQLNQIHMFTWKLVILLLSKKWYKMINNHDGLHIGHITGGSVIWSMCNIPTLLHIDIKREVILWCGWLYLAHSKLIKLCKCWQSLPTGRMGRVPPPADPTIFILTLYSLCTQVMLIFILINVQYL